MDDTLAVVGSIHFAKDLHSFRVASDFLEEYILQNKPDAIVSGGAFGIDELAIVWAEVLHIPYEEFLPTNNRWEPDGFKERNIQIVEACTRLVCIRHYLAKTYGSGWTADHAERNRIPVERYLYNGRYEIEKL